MIAGIVIAMLGSILFGMAALAESVDGDKNRAIGLGALALLLFLMAVAIAANMTGRI